MSDDYDLCDEPNEDDLRAIDDRHYKNQWQSVKGVKLSPSEYELCDDDYLLLRESKKSRLTQAYSSDDSYESSFIGDTGVSSEEEAPRLEQREPSPLPHSKLKWQLPTYRNAFSLPNKTTKVEEVVSDVKRVNTSSAWKTFMEESREKQGYKQGSKGKTLFNKKG